MSHVRDLTSVLAPEMFSNDLKDREMHLTPLGKLLLKKEKQTDSLIFMSIFLI